MIRHNIGPELPLWSIEFKTSSKLEILSRREMEQMLVKQAWQDELFRIRLMNAPKETISEFFSVTLPESLSVEMLEETEQSIFLVLPHNPYKDIPGQELKKALGMDLEDIAGWMLEQQKSLFPGSMQGNILLVAKAWRDADFKQRLLADPKTVLEQELGLNFREEMTIGMLEESADKVYIVLPYLPDLAFAEFEADLSHINQPIVIGSNSTPSNTQGQGVCTLNPRNPQC